MYTDGHEHLHMRGDVSSPKPVIHHSLPSRPKLHTVDADIPKTTHAILVPLRIRLSVSVTNSHPHSNVDDVDGRVEIHHGILHRPRFRIDANADSVF